MYHAQSVIQVALNLTLLSNSSTVAVPFRRVALPSAKPKNQYIEYLALLTGRPDMLAQGLEQKYQSTNRQKQYGA
ncbi:hypothetical protein MOVI109754_22480 [Moritella viscosa]